MSTPGQGPEPAAGEAPDPMVGQLLADRYRIIAKLGEGAMGAVYVGEHLRIGRRDAIKVLRPGLAGDAEAIARFTRGTRNVSAIRHPNVCTIYDFSDTPEGVRYLAMEFVEGETLKEVLDREGRLELPRAVEITRQVADALQAAHEVGVVHRDLKPGNIMLCRRPDGRDIVKVVDFDIAKGPDEAQGEEVTRLGFVVGTPEYMSPEQLMGDRLDGRSDLYSLGVVLFRMLSGALPFRAASTQEIMVQRLTGDPLRLEDVAPGLAVPAALQQALARGLSKRAQDRQASAADFGREVVAALGPSPAAPPPATRRPAELAPTQVGPRVQPPPASAGGLSTAPRRTPWALIGGGTAVVLAVVAGGYWLATREPAPTDASLRPDSSAAVTAAVPIDTSDTELYGGPDPGETGDTGGAQTGGETAGAGGAGGTVPSPRTSPGRGAGLPPGGVAAMLDRQMEAVLAGVSGAALRAVRDSGDIGWQLAPTRTDSATAALLLAQVAYNSQNDAECLRWARRAAALGSRGADILVTSCQ